MAEPARSPTSGSGLRSTATRRPLTIALWVGAIALTWVVAYGRYHTSLSSKPGVDFGYFLSAAGNVASGHSPYQGLPPYVYPPLIALLLAPFAHVDTIHLAHAWNGLTVLAAVVGAAVFVYDQASRIASWLCPMLFAGCVFTVLDIHYWPTNRDLQLGQSDTITLAVLLVATLAASRAWPVTRGGLIGPCALLKTWPAAIGLSLLQRALDRRRRALAAFVAVLLLAPLMAVAVGGGSGFVVFVQNTFDARWQPGFNESTWGTPVMLFSGTNFARPLLVSLPLKVAVTLALTSVVLVLLIVALRTAGDPAICTFNVVFCVILVVPVSHRQYTLYALPLLWLWTARLLRGAPFDRRQVALVGVLVLWWLLQTTTSLVPRPYQPVSSLRASVPFISDLAACAGSVLLARGLAREMPRLVGGTCDQIGVT